MRFFIFSKFIFILVLSTLNFGLAPTYADVEKTPIISPTLDQLFITLKKTKNSKKAKNITNQIWAKWQKSESPTIDFLLIKIDEATKKEQTYVALDLLDTVIHLMPQYAEGWNRRATLHYSAQNFEKSIADITRVLALEPRHFGALAGMAAILEHRGKKEQAYKVLEKLLAIYPANKNAQNRISKLAEELAGQKL